MARGGIDKNDAGWPGGVVYYRDLVGKKGPTFIIKKRIQGRLYKLSTRCTTLRAAMKELERFEANPKGYQGARDSATPTTATGAAKPLPFDKSLTDAFLTWSRDVKGNTPAWVGQQKEYLAWWAENLGGRDLKALQLHEDVEPALGQELKPGDAGYSTRAKRIAVFKGLYAWLRTSSDARAHGFGILPAEDPLFGALKIPQSDPNARVTEEKAIPQRDILKVIGALTDAHFRDALTIQAGTGWHVTEVVRFAAAGEVETASHSREHVLVCPQSKDGGALRTAVGKEVAKAGTRLRAYGSFSRARYDKAVREACTAAKVKVFAPGRMRHSVATHAINQGADMATVSTFLNHKSPATTRKFYATHGVAKRPPTIL